MPVDEREDHRVERAVGFLKERGGLLGLERAPARDVRDLGEEPRAKEQERLGRLAQRQRPALRLDAVLAAERLSLLQVLLASGPPHGVEVAAEQIAHAHPALAEPAQRGL